MTSQAPQPHTPKTAARQLRRHRLWAWGFVAIGVLLLAANLGVLPEPARQMVRLSWPAAVVAAGLWLILASRFQPGSLPGFAVDRGEAGRGELIAATGAADLQVQAFAGASQLIVGQFPAPRGPQVTAEGATTRVVLASRLAVPLLPGRCWAAALAKGVPWALDLSSSLGDFEMDLRDLTLERVRLRSLLGHIDLTLPAAGQADFDLSVSLGDITLRVPEEMAIRLKVAAGPLATLSVDARRFVELAPGEWASPLFAVSTNRCTLGLQLGAGELKLA